MLEPSEFPPTAVHSQLAPRSLVAGIPNDLLRRASTDALSAPSHKTATFRPTAPRAPRIWPIVTCTWALLASGRVLFYALEHVRYPDIVPPVTADAVEGVVLWPCAILGCWVVISIWQRRGSRLAIAAALSGAVIFGVLSRLAYGVGALFNRSDPASGHWLAQLTSTNPGYLLPWASNTVEYAALYLSCLGLSMGYMSYRGFNEARFGHQRAELVATTERLRALRTQLNPHFLFNALNSIVGMSVSSPDIARTLTTQLGDLMRRTLRASESEWHSLEEELAYVTEYLNLQDVRQPHHIDWHINARAPLTLEVPTLILLPLIENAVVHGKAPPGAPIRLAINVSATATQIVMQALNTLALPRTEDGPPGIGIGLLNLRKRLTILFGSTATLHTDCPAGTRWRTTITWTLRDPTESFGLGGSP